MRRDHRGNQDAPPQPYTGWINPYYFVGPTSLGASKPWWANAKWLPVPHDRHTPGLLSGWIEVEVVTKAYLSLQDPERTWWRKLPNGTHRVSDFFTVNGGLAIPGSEFRGMVRSAMEAVLDARAAVLGETGPLAPPDGRYRFRMTAGNEVTSREPGILNLGDKTITPCRMLKLPIGPFEKWCHARDPQAPSPREALLKWHGKPLEVKGAWIHRRTNSLSGEVVCEIREPGTGTSETVLNEASRRQETSVRVQMDSQRKLVLGKEITRSDGKTKWVKVGSGPELDRTGFSVGVTVAAETASFSELRLDGKHSSQRVVAMSDATHSWDAYTDAQHSAWSDGYVYIPRDIHDRRDPTNAQYVHVFVPIPKKQTIPADEAHAEAVEADVDESGRKRFDERKFTGPGNADSVFVRYLPQGGTVKHLGAVGLYKLREKHTYGQVRDRTPFLAPAATLSQLDPVSRLFGWVPEREGSEQGFRGRLSFEHLAGPPADNGALTDWTVLPPRGQPKPQFYLFYLVGSNGGIGRYSDGAARFRGRKFYWHYQGAVRGSLSHLCPEQVAKSVTTQNATERLCNPNQTFTGRIYFDNLEEWELGALLWTLTFSAAPREGSAEHGHHLGGGAATGFGSVQIRVKEVLQVDHGKEWENLTADGISAIDGTSQVAEFLKRCGSAIGLSDDGTPVDREDCCMWDWWQAHRLEALALWPNAGPIGIGYPKGTEEDAPPWFGQMRGQRRSDRSGNEEPLRSVREILAGIGQSQPRRQHN